GVLDEPSLRLLPKDEVLERRASKRREATVDAGGVGLPDAAGFRRQQVFRALLFGPRNGDAEILGAREPAAPADRRGLRRGPDVAQDPSERTDPGRAGNRGLGRRLHAWRPESTECRGGLVESIPVRSIQRLVSSRRVVAGWREAGHAPRKRRRSRRRGSRRA